MISEPRIIEPLTVAGGPLIARHRKADAAHPKAACEATQTRRRWTHTRSVPAADRRSPDAHATERRRSLSRSHPERAAEPLKNHRISAR
jgi:hypothetical protein